MNNTLTNYYNMITTVINTELDVNEDGSIKRKLKSGKWKTIKNKVNHNKGYNVILIDKKQFMRSSIIAHTYLNLDINRNVYLIYHLDGDKLNSAVCNLEVIIKN